VILIAKALRLARVNEGSHSFTCHPHLSTSGMSHPAFTPHPQSIASSPHFGQYSFPILLRVGWLVEFNVPFQHRYGYISDDPAEGRRLSWPGGKWPACVHLSVSVLDVEARLHPAAQS